MRLFLRSDRKATNPVTYRGEDAVYIFLRCILQEEEALRATMAKTMSINSQHEIANLRDLTGYVKLCKVDWSVKVAR